MKKHILILSLLLSTALLVGQIVPGIVASESGVVTNGLIFRTDVIKPACYPGTGTTLYDLTDNDLDGTLNAADMIIGDSIRLNNTTDDISFGHDVLLEPDSITVSLWFNATDHSDRHIICTKWRGWTVEVGANKKPYFKVYITGDNDSVYSAVDVEWGEWNYLVGTFDSNYDLRFYLNGEQTGSRSETGVIAYNSGAFGIPYNADPTRGSGYLGPIMIYNRPLSVAEIRQNFNAYKSRFGY